MTRWEAQEASSCAAEKEICSDALLKVFSLNYRSTAACSECYQNINYLSLFTELAETPLPLHMLSSQTQVQLTA